MGYGLKSKVAGFDKRRILNKSKTRYIKIDQKKQVKGGKKGALGRQRFQEEINHRSNSIECPLLSIFQ